MRTGPGQAGDNPWDRSRHGDHARGEGVGSGIAAGCASDTVMHDDSSADTSTRRWSVLSKRSPGSSTMSRVSLSIVTHTEPLRHSMPTPAPSGTAKTERFGRLTWKREVLDEKVTAGEEEEVIEEEEEVLMASSIAFTMRMNIVNRSPFYTRSFGTRCMRTENAKAANATGVELPPLELLRSFEAAARRLSFTLAASELHLTQSAVSRQIQQLEASLGVLLFERRHRALSLTEAGGVLQRAVTDSLERLRDATARVRASSAPRQVAITTTPGFASIWLIPKLARFTGSHPQVDVRVSATLDVLDLESSRIDLAVRFVPIGRGVGPALFEESVIPLCSPQLAASLRELSDFSKLTLLTVEYPDHSEAPTADWEPWLKVMGLEDLRMKSTLRFTQYADAVSAAVAGQGVVIGRLPLLSELVRDGRLVAPLGEGVASHRGYFIEMSRRAAGNRDAQEFAQWLRDEAEAAQRS